MTATFLKELRMEMCRRAFLAAALLVIAVLLAVPAFARQKIEQSSAPGTKDVYVTIDGIRLHYVDWGGQGEVVLFLGPLMGGAHVFDSLAPHFTDRFQHSGLS